MWFTIALSSIPLNLLYNTAIISTLSVREFSVFVIDIGSFTDVSLNLPLLASIGYHFNETNEEILKNIFKDTIGLEKQDWKACQATIAKPVSAYTDIIVVSSGNSTENGSMTSLSTLYFGYGIMSRDLSSTIHGSFESIYCFDKNMDESCIIEANYCLNKRVGEHCMVQFSLVILIIVVVCNFVKFVVMAHLCWRPLPQPLIALGDSISSFLSKPDPTTRPASFDQRVELPRLSSWKDRDEAHSSWNPGRAHWFRAGSTRRWTLCTLL